MNVVQDSKTKWIKAKIMSCLWYKSWYEYGNWTLNVLRAVRQLTMGVDQTLDIVRFLILGSEFFLLFKNIFNPSTYDMNEVSGTGLFQKRFGNCLSATVVKMVEYGHCILTLTLVLCYDRCINWTGDCLPLLQSFLDEFRYT